MRAIYVFHIFTGFILIGMLVVFLKLGDSPPGRSGIVGIAPASGVNVGALQPARAPRAPLTFTDHLGNTVSELDYRGSHALLFFGYTSCPDVCPANLAVMASAMRTLEDDGSRVQPLFISFDPERDTPEVLQRYVKHFHPRLVGLTGSPEEIAAATKAYGVYFNVSSRDPVDPGRFDFEHSSQTFLIDPDGKAVALFQHDTDSIEMAEAIRGELARFSTELEPRP